MTKNSFLHPVNELHYDAYKPEDAHEALATTEQIAVNRLATIEAILDNERTFENTLLALTRSTKEFDLVTGLIMHLEHVIGKPWRKASLEASAAASRLASEIGLNTNLYEALVSLKESSNYQSASQPLKKLLDDRIRRYKLSGIDLPEKEKLRLKELRQQLNKASIAFGQNTVKATDKAGVHIQDKSELKGLTDSFIKECKQAAKQKKLPGYWIQMSTPNYVNVMTNCHVRATRLAMYKSSKSDGLAPNLPLAKQILKLRYTIAELLGYPHYADYVTAERMAKTGQRARNFIMELQEKYQLGLTAELEELEQFARELEEDPNLTLHVSDFESGLDFYYAARLRNKKHDFNEKILQEHLAFPNVLNGMFEVLSTLYGITLKELADTPVWHKDVQVYAIYDEANQHIATVWCDWFARKGKRQGAWMNNLYVAERAPNTVTEPHLGQVCANLQPPTGDKPSLLTFNEVITIWHEFGHFIHLALNQTKLPEHSMMHTEWDFIEAPSQIMENWPWQPEVLKIFARHYKTGEPIPDELISKLRATRNFRVASKAMRQLTFALTDLSLHMDFAQKVDTTDPVAVGREIKQHIYNVPSEEYDLSLLNFNHIFSGGYAAGYYSYKWAEAIQADFFVTKFGDSSALSPKVGQEYRNKVLARGSEIPAEQIVRDFLGRESTTDAMLKQDGLL